MKNLGPLDPSTWYFGTYSLTEEVHDWKKMQLDVEVSPPVIVLNPNSQGSSSPLSYLTNIASPSQSSNFATRGTNIVVKLQTPSYNTF